MRFVVVGTSGCGKTVFARALAHHLSAEHIELDALFWSADWTPRPPAEFVEAVRQAALSECWVADGNYSAVREVLWSRATHIVWLHFSRTVVFPRVLWRTLRRALTRQPFWHGNRESLVKALFSHDSIILWSLTTYSKNVRKYTALRDHPAYSHLQWSVLTKPAQAKRFLALHATTAA
jgi:adenylate kinase family enzyme